jgi:hypothetical protein
MLRPALLACFAVLPAAALEPQIDDFIDIRVSGGVLAGSNYRTNLTFMGGASLVSGVGRREEGDVDAALLLGFRGTLASIDVEFAGGANDTMKTTGGSLLAGIGFWIGRRQNVEVVVEYGRGYASNRGSGVVTDGDAGEYDLRGLAVNYLWLFDNRWVLGGSAGYSRLDVSVPVSGGGNVDGRGDGLDASAIVGYRF